MLLPEFSPSDLTGRGMTSQRTRDRLAKRLEQQGIQDNRVLDAMRHVPRHLFVDEALAHRAYEDTALPIGFGQTLSRPLTVARMTELTLAERPGKVLELGTGSGYQACVLAELIGSIYSLERIRPLHERAAWRLGQLKVRAFLEHGDGNLGWPQAAPFDVILVTACARLLDDALLQQLSDGGVLIAPLEAADGNQWLTAIRRHGDTFERQCLEPVRFVPLLEGVVV